MSDIDAVLNRLDTDQDAALERLLTLLRIPSISTDPAYKGECRKAAEHMAADLQNLGFNATLRDTPGHPMVVGHDDSAGPDAPHFLFYGHYDVQPVDPLNLWDTDPFDPQLVTRDDGSKMIVARGAQDDKGQLMTFVEACRAWKTETGKLPCRITVFLEGEEESGSPSLPGFLAEHGDELKADAALVCDTEMWSTTRPAICIGLRGLVGEQVTVKAAEMDLHSGTFGGPAANPIRVLAKILAGLHDDTGRITIPDFYNGVIETPDEVKDQWETLGFSTEEFLGGVGLSTPAGEQGRSTLEMIWARPTCEFNGITGGYTGEGFKTVLPAEASAKISCRLVGDQDPDAIRTNLRAYIESCLPPDCSVEFHPHGGSGGISLPADNPVIQKAKTALTDEWNEEAAVIGMGGSIPVVGQFKDLLGMNCLLVGYGLKDDRIHSPNEKYDLKSFQRGARSWARILDALSV